MRHDLPPPAGHKPSERLIGEDAPSDPLQSLPCSATILGSTGTIGVQTLSLLRRYPEIRVEALTAMSNVSLLAEQALRVRPTLAVVGDERRYGDLKDALAGSGVEVAAGQAAVIEAASRPTSWVMSAIVGFAALEPTVAALRRGATVAMANKEAIVCAGTLIMSEAATGGGRVIPVDSEHSGLFQLLSRCRITEVSRVALTASGGPFRTHTMEQLKTVSPADAVQHPKWKMGPKISVDSATLVNKGLEVIEAHYLFGLPSEHIGVLVHPEAIVHALVYMRDGSVLSQLGMHDMRVPIAVALGWPHRLDLPDLSLGLPEMTSLTFHEVDHERFGAILLAHDSLSLGPSGPIIYNAANEVAVRAFLGGEITYLDIVDSVRDALARIPTFAVQSLADVLAGDEMARELSTQLLRDRRP